MEFIKEWTYTVCITLIVSVVFSLLTPKGNMGKFFKIILATFILLSFIYPFKNGDIDFDIPGFSFDSAYEEENLVYENAVGIQIDEILIKGGYESCIIDCDTEYSGDEIEIKSVIIWIPTEYDKDKLKNYVYENIGIISEVYYLGE